MVKILGVIFKIPLSYIIGDEGMGYFNSAYSIYTLFFIICTTGVPKAITLILSKSEDNKYIYDKYVVKTALSVFGTASLCITVLLALTAGPLVRIIGSPKTYFSLLSITPSIFFVTVAGVFRGALNAKHKYIGIAGSQISEAALKVILGVLLSMWGVSAGMDNSCISALAILGITVASLVSMIWLMICYKMSRTEVNVRQKLISIDKQKIRKDILSLAIPVSIGAFILNLIGAVDTFVIINGLQRTGLSDSEAIALYGNYTTLSVPMLNLVVSVLTPLTVIALPELARHNSINHNNEYRFIFENTLKMSCVLCAPCCAAFSFYSFNLLDTLYSAQSSYVGAPMLVALSPGIYFLVALGVINTAHESKGNIKRALSSLLLGALIKPIICVTLLYFGFGILSAPISSTAAYLSSLIYSLVCLKRDDKKVCVAINMLIPLVVAYISFSVVGLSKVIFTYKTNSLILTYCSIIISFVVYFIIVFPILYRSEIMGLVTKLTKRKSVKYRN